MFPVHSQVPGKVFLLGEYAVLKKNHALLATVSPRFSLIEKGNLDFSEASPSGKLLKLFPKEKKRWRFVDPYQGKGGFGASTAQFALLAWRLIRNPTPWKIWRLYKKLTKNGLSSPSGADLLCQISGGIQWIDFKEKTLQDLWPRFPWERIFVFSATSQPGRKTPTHTHLESFSFDSIPFRCLERELLGAKKAILTQDELLFSKTLNQYGEILRKASLEHPKTTEDKKYLSQLPGVLAVKGSGAYQADVLVVFLKEGTDPSALIRAGKNRSLELVSAGLTCEKGIL